MPQHCRICAHPERQAIDGVLADGWPSLRSIGAQYGVTKDSLLRHYRAHVSVTEESPDVPTPDEPRQIAGKLPLKMSEEPLQVATPEKDAQDAEAQYQAFIERWRGCLFVSPDEMADWPFEAEESGELLRRAFNRGDLFKFGKYYAASAQAIRRFNA